MKRMLSFLKDNDAVEKIIGGIFGAIAIIAIVIEMALDGFDSAAIVGGIKDIAGTAITIVMLIVAVNALRPKEETLTGFKAVFDNEMKIILKMIHARYSIEKIINTKNIFISFFKNVKNNRL